MGKEDYTGYAPQRVSHKVLAHEHVVSCTQLQNIKVSKVDKPAQGFTDIFTNQWVSDIFGDIFCIVLPQRNLFLYMEYNIHNSLYFLNNFKWHFTLPSSSLSYKY